MTLTFTVNIDKNQYNVGFGSVPIRIQNIRSTTTTYGAARFYLSSSGSGHFSGNVYTDATSNEKFLRFGGRIGTAALWDSVECIYTPTSSGSHVITVRGLPYAVDSNNQLTGEGSTASATVSISAMVCNNAIAMFTSTPNDGYAPLTVNFNCVTPDQNISILWDFGDGTTSTQRSPTHTYQNAGQYRPKLTVQGWKSASCPGTAPSNSVQDRIIDAFRAGVPQCVTGIRCNTGAGYYEECINGRYVLTTTPCGATTTQAQVAAAQAQYTAAVVAASQSDPTVQQTSQTSQAVAAAIAAATSAQAGSSGTSGGTAPIYQQSTGSQTAGGGNVNPSGPSPIFSFTNMLFNPITLAAAGLGVAGIAIYFWKRKGRGEL
jgi:PKD repeat protein